MIWLLAALALGGQPSAAFQARVTGRHVATQTADEARPDIEAAIDRTVASLPWAFRPFARSPLRRTTTMCTAWDLRLDDEVFSLRCVDDPEALDFEVRLDNTTVHQDGGEAYAVAIRVVDGASVEVTWDGPRGGQTNLWSFGPDGIMQRHCKVYSQHLPEPLRWSYGYARRE